MKVLIIHHNDRDGFTSAAIMTKFINEYPMNVETKPVIEYMESNYNIPITAVLKDQHAALYDYVCIVDISISSYNDMKDFYEYVNENLINKMIYIDHHKTTVNIEKQYLQDTNATKIAGLRVSGISATGLCWILYHEDEDTDIAKKLFECNGNISPSDGTTLVVNAMAPPYIVYTNRYDIFDMDENVSIFNKYDHNANLSDILDLVMDDTALHNWEFNKSRYDIGKCIKRYIDSANISALKTAKSIHVIEKDGSIKKLLALNTQNKGSETFDSINPDEFDYFCIYKYDASICKYEISIYKSPKSNSDASNIAMHFGGGGHAGAAGFKSITNIFESSDVIDLRETNNSI